jgi:hypothetical protein
MLHRHLLMTSLASLLLQAGSPVPSLAAEPSGASAPTATEAPLPTGAPSPGRRNPSVADPDNSARAERRRSTPSCVTVYSQGSGEVWVHNGCSTQQRVKVIIAWGPDTPCLAINQGRYGHYTWLLGRFDGLTSC